MRIPPCSAREIGKRVQRHGIRATKKDGTLRAHLPTPGQPPVAETSEQLHEQLAAHSNRSRVKRLQHCRVGVLCHDITDGRRDVMVTDSNEQHGCELGRGMRVQAYGNGRGNDYVLKAAQDIVEEIRGYLR